MEEDHLFHPIKARLYRNKLNGARKGYYAKADANLEPLTMHRVPANI